MADTSSQDGSTVEPSETMEPETPTEESPTMEEGNDVSEHGPISSAKDSETDGKTETEEAVDGDSEAQKETTGKTEEIQVDETPSESKAVTEIPPAFVSEPVPSTNSFDSMENENIDTATTKEDEADEEEGEDDEGPLPPITPSPARQRAKQAEQKLRNRLTKFSSSSSIRSNGSFIEDDDLSLKSEQLSTTPEKQAGSDLSPLTKSDTNEELDTTPRASSLLADSPRQFSFTSMRQLSATGSTDASVVPLTALEVKELALSEDIPRIQAACHQLEGQIVTSLAKHESDPYGPQISQETQQWMDWEIRLQNRLLDLLKHYYEEKGSEEGKTRKDNAADPSNDENSDEKQTESSQSEHKDDKSTSRVTTMPTTEALNAKKELVLVHCRLASLWAWYNQSQVLDSEVAQRESFVAAEKDAVEDNVDSLDYCRFKATYHLEQALCYSREVKGESKKLATSETISRKEPIHWQSEYKTLRLEARLRQKWREYDTSLVSLEEAQNILLGSMAAATKGEKDKSEKGGSGLPKPGPGINHHHIFLELCSIQVEMAGLHAKMNSTQLAIETLKETAKAIIIEQDEMEKERKKTSQDEAELMLLGLEFDRVTAAIYGKLGTLLIQSNRPKKAAAFLAMSLELTWAIYNSPKRKQTQKDKQAAKLDDKRLRQQAERLSKQLSQAISAMKLLDNEEEEKSAVSPPGTLVQAKDVAPETMEFGVQVDLSEELMAPNTPTPMELPPSPPVEVFPYTMPRALGFSAKTWWMVDIHSYEAEADEEKADMSLPRQGATPLVLRCMRQHGWEAGFARRVLLSYRQFLVIKKKYQDFKGKTFSPCAAVEKMWMSHCMDMRNYYLDCMLLVGEFCNYIVDEDITQPKEKASRLETTILTLRREFGDRVDAELWFLDADGVKSLISPTRNPIQKVAASMTQSTPMKSKSFRAKGSGKKV